MSPTEFAMLCKSPNSFDNYTRREKLKALCLIYALVFAEDPIHGSAFDNEIIDSIRILVDKWETKE